MSIAHELHLEQAYVARLYETLCAQRVDAEAVLRDILSRAETGMQARFERDRSAETISDRLRQLDPEVQRLCFGKIVEATSHAARYVGRFAVHDDAHEPLLVDWRAPAAERFYRATAVDPMGLALRRHLIMVGRELMGLEDDLLTLDETGGVAGTTLVGEGALMDEIGRAHV